jgi:zinc protease
MFGAVVKPGDDINKVRDEMVRIIESFGDAPPEAGEIQRTRQSFANQAEKALANHESLGVQMSEYIALGDWRLFFLARDELDKIDAARVQAAAKKYFRRDNRTVGFFLPEDNPQRAEIPATPTLAQVMKDFKPKQDTTVSESFDPSQDNINKRTKRFEVDGIKVALPRQEEPRRDGERRHRDEDRKREGALRPGDKRNARQPHAHARYHEVHARAALRRIRAAQDLRAHQRSRWRHPDHAPQSRSGAAPCGARAARTHLPRVGVRAVEEPDGDLDHGEHVEPEARASDAMSKHFNIYPRGDGATPRASRSRWRT